MQPEIKITPPKTISFDLAEIWKNRELLYFFTWRDIKVKYKQTYLGILWVVLQPLLLMLLFYFLFFKTLNIHVGVAYPVYSFAGLILWSLFSTGITHSSENLLSSSQIIRKIYFPRLIIPLSSLLTAMIDFLVAFILLFALLIIFRQSISWKAVFCFPIAIIMAVTSSFGFGSLFSALNVKYRDFPYLLPFGIQLLFFSSQIVYSIHSLPGPLSWLLYCNPLNGALEIFYYPFQNQDLNITGILISAATTFVFFISGLIYFKKTEVYFADLI